MADIVQTAYMAVSPVACLHLMRVAWRSATVLELRHQNNRWNSLQRVGFIDMLSYVAPLSGHNRSAQRRLSLSC